MATDNLMIPEGWTADPERPALHGAATKLMGLTGFDFLTAVQHVELAQREAQRNPPAAAIAAPSGGVTGALAATASRLDGNPATRIVEGERVEFIRGVEYIRGPNTGVRT